MGAAVFRTIFAQPTAEAVSSTWDTVGDQPAANFPKIRPLMDETKAEVLAFTAFPRSHWAKIWSTNPLERVNKEISRFGEVAVWRSAKGRVCAPRDDKSRVSWHGSRYPSSGPGVRHGRQVQF